MSSHLTFVQAFFSSPFPSLFPLFFVVGGFGLVVGFIVGVVVVVVSSCAELCNGDDPNPLVNPNAPLALIFLALPLAGCSLRVACAP